MPSHWVRFLIAVILGLVAGLVYGWVINPVEYVDTTPDTLRADYRSDYVVMVAEVYNARHDADLAARQLAILGSEQPAKIAAQALEFARQAGYPESDLTLLHNLVTALQVWQPPPGGSLP